MSGKVYISYRPEDAEHARPLVQGLERALGEPRVLAEAALEPASGEPQRPIEANFAQARALVAVIGPGWLEAKRGDGRRRLDDPEDAVRLAIERALQRGLPVITALVGGAPLPKRDELPVPLQAMLARPPAILADGGGRAAIAGLAGDLKALGVGQSGTGRWLIGAVAAAAAIAGLIWLARPDLVSGPATRPPPVAPKAQAPTAAEIAAKEAADTQSFTAAETGGTVEAFERYLRERPEGRHAQAARERIRTLVRLEERLAELKRGGDVAALETFGRENPALREKVSAAIAERAAEAKRAEEEKAKAAEKVEVAKAELPPAPAPAPSPSAPVGEVNASTPPGHAFRDCSEDCPEMVAIVTGSIVMGSPQDEAGRESGEGPLRRVTVKKRLAVGRYEVTVAELAAFMKATGRTPASEGCSIATPAGPKTESGRSWRDPGFEQGDRHPAVCVSFEEAEAYARWLSERTGKRYRLLSEVEWEFAARAGAKTAFPWGNLIGIGNAHFAAGPEAAAGTRPVGSHPENSWGLYDVAGNAAEWTADCWLADYQSLENEQARTRGDCGQRVVRGGAWNSPARQIRAAQRLKHEARGRFNTVGFRVAREL